MSVHALPPDGVRVVDVNAFFRQNPGAEVSMCRDCGALVLAGPSAVCHDSWHEQYEARYRLSQADRVAYPE